MNTFNFTTASVFIISPLYKRNKYDAGRHLTRERTIIVIEIALKNIFKRTPSCLVVNIYFSSYYYIRVHIKKNPYSPVLIELWPIIFWTILRDTYNCTTRKPKLTNCRLRICKSTARYNAKTNVRLPIVRRFYTFIIFCVFIRVA